MLGNDSLNTLNMFPQGLKYGESYPGFRQTSLRLATIMLVGLICG